MTLRLFRLFVCLGIAFCAIGTADAAGVAPAAGEPRVAQPRVALVIGEAAYRTGALPTSANDAGLIAQALAQAGFTVTAYADLPASAVRAAFARFVAEARRAGPGAVAVVSLAGYGVQFDGHDFLVPIDARLARDVDVPAEAVDLSELARDLAALPLESRISLYDLARPNPFAREGTPLASGLAVVEPPTGSLVVFNTAPGAVASPDQGHYGAFAEGVAAMMRVQGMPADAMVARLRARLDAASGGESVPWMGGGLYAPFSFFPAERAGAGNGHAGDSSPADAYWDAILSDTAKAYADFLKAYPNDPRASRVAVLLAARVEASTWAQTCRVDTPSAYWTYLRRYPRGPHFADARRLLAAIPAALEPPPRFETYPFAGVPLPRPGDLAIVGKSFVFLDDDSFAPLPPLPATIAGEGPLGLAGLLPPLLPMAPGDPPLPFPVPLGFAANAGRIVQPGIGVRPISSKGSSPVMALDPLDTAGGLQLIQTAPDGTILSVATLAGGPNGKRTITQTGPDNQVALTMVETPGANGAGVVTQAGPGHPVLSTTKTAIDSSGNRVVTIAGPDDRPVATVVTTSDGLTVRRLGGGRVGDGAAVSRGPLPRPTVLQAAPKPPDVVPPASAASQASDLRILSQAAAVPSLADPIAPKDVVAPTIKPIDPPTIREPVVPLTVPPVPAFAAVPTVPDILAPRAPQEPAAPPVQAAPNPESPVAPRQAEPVPPRKDGAETGKDTRHYDAVLAPGVPSPEAAKPAAAQQPLPPQRPALAVAKLRPPPRRAVTRAKPAGKPPRGIRRQRR